MNEEAALLRAICDFPDEDTPRLVFADWLAEQGGPVNAAWANGIRAQVWRARGAADAATAQQSRVFGSAYGQAKVRERLGIPAGLNVAGWERGFPTTVVEPFVTLYEVWPRLAFRVPIRNLHVYEASEAGAAEFVTWPGLSILRELTFDVVWAVPRPGDVIATLAGCVALSGLRTLAVAYARLTDEAVTAILDSPHLAGLETLTLQPEYNAGRISPELVGRLRARFGPDVLSDGFDGIPF
jgi:uncharacterized protein (TIGR02996 family)